MTTQITPNVQHLNSAAPVFRRHTISHVSAASSLRREARQAQEKQRLLVALLPMVKRVAFQMRERLPAHVEVDDLIANGMLGLVDAVAKFDAGKRVKLESYARHRVRGAILDGLRGADPASRDLRRTQKRIHKLYRELEAKLGRPVQDQEMAAATGTDLAQWHRTLDEIQSVGFDFGARTITAGLSTKRPSAEPALLAGDQADPFDRCYHREQQEIMGRAMFHLRERDREIITLYYHQELTMKQIAERLHVDESRVSQIHSAALVRLKAGVSSLLTPRQAKSPESKPLLMLAAAA